MDTRLTLARSRDTVHEYHKYEQRPGATKCGIQIDRKHASR